MTHLCRSLSVGRDLTGVLWELIAQSSPDAWERSKYLVMYLHDSRHRRWIPVPVKPVPLLRPWSSSAPCSLIKIGDEDKPPSTVLLEFHKKNKSCYLSTHFWGIIVTRKNLVYLCHKKWRRHKYFKHVDGFLLVFYSVTHCLCWCHSPSVISVVPR